MSSRWRRISGPSGGRTARRRQLKPIQFGQGGLEDEIAAGGLELLHQIAGSSVKGAVPGFDQSMANGAQDVGLAGAGIAAI